LNIAHCLKRDVWITYQLCEGTWPILAPADGLESVTIKFFDFCKKYSYITH